MKHALKTFALIASTLIAACGDDDAPTTPDASTGGGGEIASRAVIVAGDFTPGHPGILTTLDPATGEIKTNAGPAMAVGSDPILRHYGHELLIVNRGENNITILNDETLELIEQIGTGPNSNPQDVAVIGTKLYVPTLGSAGVTVLTRGSTKLSVIDLSADDPSDGKPDCNSIYAVGSDLYVSCGRLESFVASGPGLVHVIDSASLEVTATFELSHENPIGLFEQIPSLGSSGHELLIPTTENFSDAPGCIERIATTDGGPKADGCLADNADLGGYVTRIDPQITDGVATVWSAVAVTDFVHANLRAYDLGTASLRAEPINPATQKIADVAHCPTGELIVVDATTNANGLRIYERGKERTTAALAIGLGFFSQHGLVCY